MSDEHTRPEDIDFDHKKTETQLKFNLMSLIQTVVSLGFGLIALITATGYLIINAYLEKFTDIQAYSVSPNQYITIGAGFLIFIAMLFMILYALINIVTRGFNKSIILVDWVKILWRDESARNNLLLLLFCALFLSARFYGYSARYLNLQENGEKKFIVILKNDFSPAYFGLQADKNNSHWTEVVLLLAKLDDGILVRANDGTVVIIKNDDIAGILDDEKRTAPTPLPTATPIPTASPTPQMSP